MSIGDVGCHYTLNIGVKCETKVVAMPPRTFRAKAFEVSWENASFKVSGTLDGFVDFAVPGGGTYPLSPDEARSLAIALNGSARDVEANCLHDKDALLEKA